MIHKEYKVIAEENKKKIQQGIKNRIMEGHTF
jgi:hypothetical protein